MKNNGDMSAFSGWFAVIVVSALLIVVPLGWWPKDPYGLIKWTMVGMGGVGIAAVWIASSIVRGRCAVRLNAINLPLLLVIGWSFLSFPLGSHRYFVDRRLTEVIFMALIYLVLVCTAGDRNKRAFLIIASMIGLTVISILGIAQYAGLYSTASPWGSTLGRRVYATMLNPNYLASFIISLFPLALSFFIFGHRGRLSLILLVLVMITASFCLLFTVSWGGWLGWLIAVVVLISLAVRRARSYLAVRKLVLIIVLFALLGSTFLYLNRSVVASDYAGMKFRLLYWRATFAMIQEQPFVGFGLNSFCPNIPKYLTRIVASDFNSGFPDDGSAVAVYEGIYAHNEYLGIWLEGGLIGLMLFIWLIGGFFYQAGRNIRFDPGTMETAINIGALCGVAAMLAQSIVSYPLRLPSTTVSYALFLALVGSGRKTNAIVVRIPFSRFIRILIALAVIGCTAALFPRLLYPLRGEIIYVEARRASFRGDWDTVAERCRAALKYSITEPEIFDLIGDAHQKLRAPQEAVKALYNKLDLKPSDVGAYFKLGKLYERLGMDDRAEWSFRRAMALERHDSPEGRVRLAELIDRQDRQDEALAVLEEGLRRYHGNWMLRNSLGIAYATREEWDRASSEFMESRAAAGGAVPLYNLRVLQKYMESSNKRERAENEFIGLRERDWIAEHIENGRSALRKSHYVRARNEFQEVLDAYPDYVPALSNMGSYFMKTQHIEKAIELWKRATELDPEHRIDPV